MHCTAWPWRGQCFGAMHDLRPYCSDSKSVDWIGLDWWPCSNTGFVSARDFKSALHFHGGAVVCNSAYDFCYGAALVPRPCPPALPSAPALPLREDTM